jgi:peptide-methionine (R)-S-oxide reductase
MTRLSLLAAAAGALLLPAAALAGAPATFVLSDAEWRKRLSPEAYDVLRHQGTELAFSSPLDHEKRAGRYLCAGCRLPLFSSKTKFDSGTGWPSFWKPLPDAVATSRDDSMMMEVRTEVHCRRCAGHLGHVFDDGPPPTGLRYCMNGVALTFVPDRK